MKTLHLRYKETKTFSLFLAISEDSLDGFFP